MKPLNTAASLMPLLLLAANCQAATALPSYNLDEVIVTATRILTPQSQVSSSTEVITRRTFRRRMHKRWVTSSDLTPVFRLRGKATGKACR